jgi:hypothetical protein
MFRSDAEGYEKWSQALASAVELVNVAATSPAESSESIFGFVMPVLLVNSGTLWVVDYDEGGQRSTPAPADEAVLFVDRQHELVSRQRKVAYRLGHLHIYTRTAFTNMLQNFSSPTGLVLERVFGFALRKVYS